MLELRGKTLDRHSFVKSVFIQFCSCFLRHWDLSLSLQIVTFSHMPLNMCCLSLDSLSHHPSLLLWSSHCSRFLPCIAILFSVLNKIHLLLLVSHSIPTLCCSKDFILAVSRLFLIAGYYEQSNSFPRSPWVSIPWRGHRFTFPSHNGAGNLPPFDLHLFLGQPPREAMTRHDLENWGITSGGVVAQGEGYPEHGRG